MRKLFAILVLGSLMTGGLIGCEASARIDDDDHDHGTTVRKTTTVREADGDRTVKTEIKRD